MLRGRLLLPRTGPAAATGPDGKPATTRRAVRRAVRSAGAEAMRVVLIGDRRAAERVFADLGFDPQPETVLRVAARPGLMVVDATAVGGKAIRRLARALPSRRPLDGIGYVPSLDGDEDRSAAEAAGRLAKLLRVRAALHLVLPRESDRPCFEPCPDPDAPDARALARGLTARLVRGWFRGGVRPDLGGVAAAPDGGLEERARAAIERTRSASLAFASLAWGGRGLVAAVERTWDRTVPRAPRVPKALAGGAALAAGIGLAVLGGIAEAHRAAELERALSVLAPVLPNARVDPAALAGEPKARRFAAAAAAVERATEPSLASPLSAFLPGGGALRRLARRAVTDAVVRPAEESLRARIAGGLRPGPDPGEWLERTGRLLAGPGGSESYGASALLAAAYVTPEAPWRRLLGPASRGLPPAVGAPLRDEAARRFVATMDAWARNRYAGSALLGHARRAADAPGWRARRAALKAVEAALDADEARWLAPRGSDRELERILARARGVLDEDAVAGGRAAASRAGDEARAALASFRLDGDLPLLDLDGGEAPALGPAAEALLRAYEALAREEEGMGSEGVFLPRRQRQVGALAADKPTLAPISGAGGGAGAAAGRLRASLRRVERAIVEAGIGPEHREWLRAEIEQAAFDEAADRIEAAAARPLAARGRAAVRDAERLARERGAVRAADRIGAVRARAEQATSRAALRALENEDPLAVEFDADTDRRAVLERVVAGIARLDALYRQGPGSGGFRWVALGRALRGYRDADPSSVLTRMAGRAREYAERGAARCEAPRPRLHPRPHPGARAAFAGGYPERALAAFERRLDTLCREARARIAAAAEGGLRTFFREHLAWRWPYADDPGAPAAPRSTLAELLRRAEPLRRTGDRAAGALPPDLRGLVGPWGLDRRGEPVLGLVVEWRTAPGRERFAEHLVSSRIEGLVSLEDGRRGWRYGDRLVAHLRLAKDSPLRFPGGAIETSIPIGEGNWVRSLAAGAATATTTVEAPVFGAGAGEEGTLRISATLRAVRAPRAIETPASPGPSPATA